MDFITKQLNRVSMRSYSNKKISELDMNKIKNVINESATSYNGQQFSAIIVNDKTMKEKLSIISGKQKHIIECDTFILFLADFNRISLANDIYVENNKEVSEKELTLKYDNLNSLLYGFVDATISAQATVDAASSLGIDSCYIGAIRNGASEVQKLFNLPNYVVPVVGITLGYGNKTDERKPKINKVYTNCYPQNQIKEEINNYEIETNKYYTNHRDANNTYANNTIKAYRMWNSGKFMDSLTLLWPNNWLDSKKK